MDAETARQILDELSSARAATRKLHAAFWFPLCLFGAVTMLAAVGGLLGGEALLGWLLFIGTMAGTVVVTWYYRRRAIRIGLVRRGWPYQATAAATIAACVVASALVPARPADAAPPWLVVTGMYLVFAWLSRDLAIAALAVLVGAVVAGFWSGLPAAPAGLLTAVESAVCLAAGVLLRWRLR